MNSGTAVADRPTTSAIATTEHGVGTKSQLLNEYESGLSSSYTPSVTLEGPEDVPDVYASAAPVLTGLSRQVTLPGETSATTSSTSEATSSMGSARPGYLRSPRSRLSQEARQWLTGDFIPVHQKVRQICVKEARQMHLAIIEFNVSIKRAWEEDSNELVVEVVVNGNLPQSLALWDAIGDELQRWGSKQPVRRRRILEEQYAIFVEATN